MSDAYYAHPFVKDPVRVEPTLVVVGEGGPWAV